MCYGGTIHLIQSIIFYIDKHNFLKCLGSLEGLERAHGVQLSAFLSQHYGKDRLISVMQSLKLLKKWNLASSTLININVSTKNHVSVFLRKNKKCLYKYCSITNDSVSEFSSDVLRREPPCAQQGEWAYQTQPSICKLTFEDFHPK